MSGKHVYSLLLQCLVYVYVCAHVWLWVPYRQRLTSANACHLTAHDVLCVVQDQANIRALYPLYLLIA